MCATTLTIKEPLKEDVHVRIMELSETGTIAKQATSLWAYAHRRPLSTKNDEQKIATHLKQTKRKMREVLKNRNREQVIYQSCLCH